MQYTSISYTVSMIYFAHRGANTQAVQNTIRAFSLAQKQGAVCYELDVHLLTDGKLAVHHDYSLLSTTGKNVNLADLSSADLARYPLLNHFGNQPEKIPLLSEILPVVTPHLQLLNIEIKNEENRYPQIETVLLDFLKPYVEISSKILFSSFDFDTLVRLRRLDKNARIGLLTRAFDISKALSLGAESVHISSARVTEEIIRVCHAHGLKLYVYTVNDKETAQRLAAWGADGIFTDCVSDFIHP